MFKGYMHLKVIYLPFYSFSWTKIISWSLTEVWLPQHAMTKVFMQSQATIFSIHVYNCLTDKSSYHFDASAERKKTHGTYFMTLDCKFLKLTQS